MDAEQDIKWVPLTLNFPPEVEALLEERAKAEGLSIKCLCLRIILDHLAGELERESPDTYAATMRHNGCPDWRAKSLEIST